ncbi:hypothetical protein O3P69_010166 [Scylla paramamosain]|uniref:Uncharacterized protein n=1 Tax=Scylla paramamosain TaxID=85552 RepID=A0AAW0TUD0_SCYPA
MFGSTTTTTTTTTPPPTTATITHSSGSTTGKCGIGLQCSAGQEWRRLPWASASPGAAARWCEGEVRQSQQLLLQQPGRHGGGVTFGMSPPEVPERSAQGGHSLCFLQPFYVDPRTKKRNPITATQAAVILLKDSCQGAWWPLRGFQFVSPRLHTSLIRVCGGKQLTYSAVRERS